MNVKHAKSNIIADFTGTVTVYNSQGSTTTVAATDLVRPSDWNSVHNNYFTFTGNTTGNSTLSGVNIPIHGAGGVSVGASNGSYVISGLSDAGFLTTAALSNHSHGNPTLFLTNLNGTTNSASNGFTLSLSAVAQTVQPVAASAANGSFNFSTLKFVDTNGVSFATSTDGIRATVKTDYLTTARASNDAVGLNTAATNVTWTVNSSGISLNAGGYAGTGTTFNGTNINGSMTQNSAGIRLDLSISPGGAADGYNSAQFTNSTANSTMPILWAGNSNGSGNVTMGLTGSTVTMSAPSGVGGGAAISAGAASQNTGTVIFSNSNGVSFGLNAGTLTATVKTDYLTTARASNDAVGLNTALTAGPLAWTVNSGGISLNAGSAAGTTSGFGGNQISGSMTHNTAGLNLSLNHPAWITTAALSDHSHGNPTLALTNLSGTTASNSAGLTLSLSAAAPGAGGGIAAAAGTQTATSGTVVFSNSNNMTFGMSNNSVITASFNPVNIGMSTNGNTAGTTGTFDGGGLQYIFVGGNNITLSQSSNGSSVSLSIVGPTPGAPTPISFFEGPSPHWGLSTQTRGFGNYLSSTNDVYLAPFFLENPISGDYIDHVMFCTFNTLTSNQSARNSAVLHWGIYQLGTGTNSTRLERVWSNSLSYCASINSGTYTLSCPVSTDTNGFTYGTVTTSATSNLSIWGNNKLIIMPFTSSLSAGRYWHAYLQVNTSSNSSHAYFISNFMGAAINTQHISHAPMTAAYASGDITNQFRNKYIGGIFSTAASLSSNTALPPNIPISGITNNNLTVQPLFRIWKS